MKIRTNSFTFFVFVIVFLMMQPFAAFSELIAPTRTLNGPQTLTGLLSVFSEPPALPVLLDGVDIGKTPVILKEVASGAHTLQVKGTEKEITVPPGKSLQLSFFKDVLIIIPEKKPHVSTNPKSEEKKKQETKPEKSNRNKEQENPLYWPMNPLGPIAE